MDNLIRNILLPTDFSEDAEVAFFHALKLALALRADLHIFHVEPANDQSDWRWAPDVLQTLIRWGYLPPGAAEADIPSSGIQVHRSMRGGMRPDAAIQDELASTHADLVVMSSHGRTGIARWLQPSVATPVALKGAVPVLFLPPDCRGFVNGQTGQSSLRRVLAPVDHRPHPAPTFDAIGSLGRALGALDLSVMAVHFGTGVVEVEMLNPEPGWRVEYSRQSGAVVDGILDLSRGWAVDMIVATTEGRQGLVDALRGSTVERLTNQTTAPLLVVPGGWGRVQEQKHPDV